MTRRNLFSKFFALAPLPLGLSQAVPAPAADQEPDLAPAPEPLHLEDVVEFASQTLVFAPGEKRNRIRSFGILDPFIEGESFVEELYVLVHTGEQSQFMVIEDRKRFYQFYRAGVSVLKVYFRFDPLRIPPEVITHEDYNKIWSCMEFLSTRVDEV